MTMTLPRRRFFVTAGLGAAGALAVPLSPLGAARETPSRDDAVLDHVGHEMARLYSLSRRQNLFAEHYQTMAANLRLLAMVYPDIRAGARKPGRPHDHGRRVREVEEVRKAFGIDISNEPEPAALPKADEARVRERFGREGAGPTLLKMAEAADAKAAQMARSSSGPALKHAQWYLLCNYQQEIQLASQIICDVSYAGVGGAQVAVACRVSQVVVVLWRLVC